MLTAPTLAAFGWLAFGGIAEATATDRFEPSLEQQLVGFQDVDFDSGWVPANGPLQLRFYAHAADSISIDMLGDALYDWNAEAIEFVGDLQGGHFAIDVGLELQASVRFDVAGFQWQSDLLGPWDYAIISEALFTPYLLPGNPDRPVEIDDQTDGFTVASVPIVPDIVIASGNLDVDVAADITASLEGLRIEATTEGDSAIVDAEGVPSPLSPATTDEALEVEGVLVTNLQTAPVLIVRPHLVMSILGQEFEIVGIDIPIALPPTDDSLVFEPQLMLFDAPEPPPAPPASDDGGPDDSGTGEPLPPFEGTSGSTGEAGSDQSGGGQLPPVGDDGCGCRSQAHAPRPTTGLAWWLLLLGVAPRRRQA
ncbi:MAG: hypothetical protein AAGF11_05810 [Myxococcota bacterium]